MKFSFSIRILRDRSARSPYAATYELARIGEEAGFDTATTGHHHFVPGIMSDPLTFLAGVAASTDALRIGTGIFQLPFHHPVRVAEHVATIDEMSGGRISHGGGVGDPADVWTHENTAYEGRFHSFPSLTVYPRPA
jgi:alkanesulfonate monooxygenase SsuD/methylene tetrahydromethanopterin reductase-like flavin-dependent oxidoreductase (luciferase family)